MGGFLGLGLSLPTVALRRRGPGGLPGGGNAALYVVEKADTLSAAGSLSIRGTASITEAADTLTAKGTTTNRGTANLSEAADTTTSSGVLSIGAAVSVIEAADTLTATGKLSIRGSASITEAADTLSANGKLTNRATATMTEAADTLSSTGTLGTASLKQFATRSSIAALYDLNHKTAMSRTSHFARDAVTSLKIALVNWYITATAEVLPGGPATFRASIEYPEGTLTQVLFGGAVDGNAADGATILSDAIAVSIPDNAKFWVRVWVNCPSGLCFRGIQTGGGVGNTRLEAGPAVTDKTMGGTLAGSDDGYIPVAAIIAATSIKSASILGDSRTSGAGDNAAEATYGEPGAILPGFAPTIPYINFSISSTAAVDHFAIKTAKRRALAAYTTHAFSALGINDLAGREAATLIADLQTVRADWGLPMFQATLDPWSTSTDGFTTLTGQTTDPQRNPRRVSFNDSVRAGLTGFAGHFEIADTTESGRNSGLWKANHTADGAHANGTGYDATLNSGVIDGHRISGEVADTTPAAFAFTDVTGAAVSTVYESNTITVSGINAAAGISVTGGEYSKNGGAYTSASGTVVAGDTVKVRQTSSASAATATDCVLTIGGVSDTFTVTTASATVSYDVPVNVIRTLITAQANNFYRISADAALEGWGNNAAVGQKAFTGDFLVEINRVDAFAKFFILGMNDNATQTNSFEDINFAFYFEGNGADSRVTIFENGSQISAHTITAGNTKFWIRRVGGNVEYRWGGATVAESTLLRSVASALTLTFDATLNTSQSWNAADVRIS